MFKNIAKHNNKSKANYFFDRVKTEHHSHDSLIY